MLGISGEHLLVLLVILLIFGPKRLPDLGHSIGRTLKNFKDGLNSTPDASPNAAPSQRVEARTAAPVAPVSPTTAAPAEGPASTANAAEDAAPAGSEKV